MKVERLEINSKEKSQKKKFSKGASSSFSKRARDVQAESVQGSATRGRRQGGIIVVDPQFCPSALVFILWVSYSPIILI